MRRAAVLLAGFGLTLGGIGLAAVPSGLGAPAIAPRIIMRPLPPVVAVPVATTTASTRAAVDVNNCVWVLHVPDFVGDEGKKKELAIYLVRKDGQVTGSAADAPSWSRQTHEVEVTRCTMSGAGTISATLKVTLNPPGGGEKQVIPVRITGRYKDGIIEATARSTNGDAVVNSKVIGEVVAPEDQFNCEVDLSCDDALNWGEKEQKRLEFAVEIRGGKVKGLVCKTPAYKKGQEALTFDASKLKLENDKVSGDLTLTVPDAKDEKREVTITVDGTRVGGLITGTFKSKIGKDGTEGAMRGYVFPLEK